MQKKIKYILFVIVLWGIVGSNGFAQEVDNLQDKKQDILMQQIDLLDWEDMNRLEEQLKASTPYMEKFSLKQQMNQLIKGEKPFNIQTILIGFFNLLFGEIRTYAGMVVRFLLIVILCNILETLSTSFETKNTTKIAFFVCYMVVLYGIVESLFLLINLAGDTINKLCDIMYVIIPTLAAFMASSGYITTSGIAYPTIIAGIGMIRFIIQTLVLPTIVMVIILQLVSNMSEDFKLDKLIELFYKGIKWVLRGVFVGSIGLLGFYKMTTVPVDMGIKKATLKFSSAFIPVVGDATVGAIDFIASCATLVKNSLSGSVIIFILVVVSIPLIKILSYVVLYHLAAAAIEPLGDKKMANMAENLAKGCEFIMSCVAIMVLLCIAALIVCMSIGQNLG